MKIYKIVLILVCILILCGCSKDNTINIDLNTVTVSKIANTILYNQYDNSDYIRINYDDNNFEDYINKYYELSKSDLSDGVVIFKGGVSAIEIAILKFNDSKLAELNISKLEDYKNRRISQFVGYAPEEEKIAEGSNIVQIENIVGLLVCQDNEKAKTEFIDIIKGKKDIQNIELSYKNLENVEIKEKNEENPYSLGDKYSEKLILEAWKTYDTSNLDEFNKKIYNKAVSVITKCIRDDMNEYEKELAIHDWMINNMDYDIGDIVRDGSIQPVEEHNNPYGALVNKYAICSGYTSTFQLFMRMLDIECETVYGYSDTDQPGDEHMWNMVKILGDWYYIDVCWDDPMHKDGDVYTYYKTGEEWEYHKYFNTTSQYLKENKHFWDESNYKVINATKYNWLKLHGIGDA